MKKLAPLLVAATLASGGISRAQNYQGTEVQGRLSNVAPAASAKPQAAQGNPEAALATDEKGKSAATSFPASTATIYLVTKNISGAKGDKVEASWVADDAGKALPAGKKFHVGAITLPDAKSYNPSLNVNGPVNGTFPPGKYHVVLSVGSKEIKSLKFTVK